jgi:hypothetical protein
MRSEVTSLETHSNGTTSSRLITSDGTPNQVMNSQFSPITTSGVPVGGSSNFNAWSIAVPLNMGFFGCYGPEKLCPVFMAGGIRIELMLQSKALSLVPISPSLTGTPFKIVTENTTSVEVGDVDTSSFTWTRALITPLNSGLRVGQAIFLVTNEVHRTKVRITSIVQGSGLLTITHDGSMDLSGTAPELIFGIPAWQGSAETLIRLPNTSIEECGLCVGQTLDVADRQTTTIKDLIITAMSEGLAEDGIVSDPVDGSFPVQDFTATSALGQITSQGSNDGTNGTANFGIERNGVALTGCVVQTVIAGGLLTSLKITTPGTTKIYPGDILEIQTGQGTQPFYIATNEFVELTVNNAFVMTGYHGQVSMSPGRWTEQSSFEVESVEYKIQEVKPSKAIMDKMAKGIDYQFRGVDLFYDSIPASSRRHQIEIPSVSSMAKCIMSVYVSSTFEDDANMQQYYTGMTPEELNLNSIQYFINNKLYPLNSYDPSNKEDRPQQMNELQKSFLSMGRQAASFGDASGSNLNGYSNTFLTCRELARNQFVFNLRSSEPSVRLAFSGVREEIVRVNTYVWAEKIMSVGPSGIQMIV